MYSKSSIQAFQSACKSSVPSFHIVLGSGFGAALNAWATDHVWQPVVDLPFSSIDGLPTSTAPDHSGKFRFFQNQKNGKTIVFQMGRIHGYEGHSAQVATMPVMISRLSGTPNFILTNAAGALDLSYKPGDVMLLRDHINLTGKNPLAGENPTFNDEPIGPRFPDMTSAYNPQLRTRLEKNLSNHSLTVHQGVYVGLLGPSFETPAEIQLFANWGLQAVGMSTVWETIALRHAGGRVAAMSLISNLGAGLSGDSPLDHFSILDTCRTSASKIVHGILDTITEELS